MQFLVYISDNAIKEAKTHHLSNDLEVIKNKVELDQTISIFDRFLPSPYIRKYMGSNIRLIACTKTINSINFIVFLKILPRGSRDYKKWLEDYTLFENLIPTDEQLIEYHNSRLKEGILPPPALPKLSETESLYLYERSTILDKDNEIVETKFWIEEIQEEKYSSYKSNYADLITSILTDLNLYSQNKIIYDHENKLGIIYKYFPSLNILFLIKPTISISEEKIQDCIPDELLEDYLEDFENYNEKKILENSRKAYPDFILAAKDLWLNIEKNDIANLALSLEEAKILNDIRLGHNPEKRFPVFINGKPGSGKSTILQFLFSDQVFKYFKYDKQNRIPYKPIYITYNKRLLDYAKSNIKKIIESNNEKIVESKINTGTYEFHIDYNDCFTTLRDLLLELLNAVDRNLFPNDNYVDFGKFKEFMKKETQKHPDSYIRNKLNPETAWHIIRNFIKGRAIDLDGYLDDQDYETEFKREHRKIPVEIFKKVYSEIWIKWYQPLCKEHHFWDDQDLALKVFHSKTKDELGLYSAVFCDEAQDFTQLELKIIMSLTYYKNRLLTSESIKDIPIAFAGDPFQTINPTGFDWDFVSAYFHEEVIKELTKFESNSRLVFNYHELEYNYRSAVSIVKFNNLIQLYRGSVFKIKNLIPQKTWFPSKEYEPRFYLSNHLGIEEQFKENEELVIIIPCQEGEEERWVAEDPLLSKFALHNQELVRNIVSPISVKGMEFNRVVLYNFGKQAILNFDTIINFHNPLNVAELITNQHEERLKLEYFLNSLYVASSRPKHRLFIVDTENGKEKFWDTFYDKSDSLIDVYETLSQTASLFKENTSSFTLGSDREWSEYKDDPLELAIMFEEQGDINKNCDELKKAEQNYLRAGAEKKARNVRAKISEIKSEFDKAGNIFYELGKYIDALRCYWKSKNFASILTIGSPNNPEISYSPKYIASQFMISENSDKYPPTKFLNYLYDNINDENSINHKKLIVEINEDKTWQEVLSNLVKRIYEFNNIDPNFRYDNAARILDLIRNIIVFNHSDLELGHIFNFARQRKKALEYWAKLPPNLRPPNFNFLMAQTQEFPNNLTWYNKISEYEEIFSIYKENKDKVRSLDNDNISYIVSALLELKEFESFFDLVKLLDKDQIELSSNQANLIFCSKVRISTSESIAEFISRKFNHRDIKTYLKNSIKYEIDQNVIIFIVALFKHLFENNIYGTIKKEYFNLVNDVKYKKYHPFIDEFILYSLYEFERNPNADTKNLIDLTTIFKDIFSKLKKTKDTTLSLDYFNGLGKIIETIGAIPDRLEFFDNCIKDKVLLDDTDSETIKSIAKERWIYIKNNPDKGHEQEKEFKELAQKLFKEWHLTRKYDSINNLPDKIIIGNNPFDYQNTISDLQKTESTKKQQKEQTDISKLLYKKKPKDFVDKNDFISAKNLTTNGTESDKLPPAEQFVATSNDNSSNYSFSVNLNLDDDKYVIYIDSSIPKTKLTRILDNEEEHVTIFHKVDEIKIDFMDDFILDNGYWLNSTWLIAIKIDSKSITFLEKNKMIEVFRITKNS